MTLLRSATLTLATALLVSASPLSAYARQASVDDVKQVASSYLTQQKNRFNANQGSTLVTKGDIAVRPVGDHFAVTFPHMTVQNRDGSFLEIGTITANVAAHSTSNDPNAWKVTLALPSPIVWYDDDKSIETKLIIGSQNLSGIWHSDIHAFSQLRSTLNDVTVKFFEDSAVDSVLVLPTVTSTIDLRSGADGTLSGPSRITINNAKMVDTDDGLTTTIGTIQLSSIIDGLSIPAAKDYQAKLNALTQSIDGEMTAEQSRALYDLTSLSLANVIKGGEVILAASDVKLTDDEYTTNIKDVHYNFQISGIPERNATLKTGLNYTGFKITPPPSDAAIIPYNGGVNITINQLPYHEFISLGRLLFSDSPAAANLATLQIMMAAPAILMASQTGISLSDTGAENDLYDLKITGGLHPERPSAWGVAGMFNIHFAGMEKLIAHIDAQAKNESPAEQRALNRISGQLSAMQLIGQQKGTDAKGRTIRTYDIEISPTGAVLVNGTDISKIPNLFTP